MTSTKICRVCWKDKQLFVHPLGAFNSEKSLCIKCLGEFRHSTIIHKCGEFCYICGDIQGVFFPCSNQNCFFLFCQNCLSGNYGRLIYYSILSGTLNKTWKCIFCDNSYSNQHLSTPDITYRAELGNFTARTFIPFSSTLNTINSVVNIPFSVKKKPLGGPYNVVSVSWFVSEKRDAEDHILRLTKNVEAFKKNFEGWVLRIYYDASVLSVHPEVSLYLLKILSEHPYVELCPFPFWPEFRNQNGLYVGGIPYLFPYLILDEMNETDTVIIRDLNNTLSFEDKSVVIQFQKSNRPIHRYYCKEYGWKFLNGGCSFNSNVTKIKSVKNVLKKIYDFLCGQFRSPSDFKSMVWERDSVFKRSKTSRSLEPERIEEKHLEQIFLESVLLNNIDHYYFSTTNVCIFGIHRTEVSTSKKAPKFCGKCKNTTIEHYFKNQSERDDSTNMFYSKLKIKTESKKYNSFLLKFLDNFEWVKNFKKQKFCPAKDYNIGKGGQNQVKKVIVKKFQGILKENNTKPEEKRIFKKRKEIFSLNCCKGKTTKNVKDSKGEKGEEKQEIDSESVKGLLKKYENRKIITRSFLKLRRIDFLNEKGPVFIDLAD